MILLIDNYDSFTYNLVHYMGEVTNGEREIRVIRNDEITTGDIETLNPSHIVISPGPCSPNEAGISVEVARRFGGSRPILGVCLGHQAIAQAFGAVIVQATEIVHGKTSQVFHKDENIFAGLEHGFSATRYHSLVVEKSSLPECLTPLAWTETLDDPGGEIMALSHRDFPDTIGVQFHPESILTNLGKELLSRFLSLPTKDQ